MRTLALLVLGLLLAPAAWSHGGQYVGPSAGGGADAGSAGVTAPSSQGGSGGAGAGNTSQPGMPASSGGRSTVRGASGRTTGGAASASSAGQPGFLGWEFWWESNRDAFLDLKGHLARGVHVPGSPGQLTARGGAALAASSRPSRQWVEAVLLPRLLDVAASADDRDVLDSTIVALARSAPETSAGAAAEAMTALLAHRELTVQAAAALGLGTLRSAPVTGDLAHLLRDDSAGRALVGGGAVPTMVRAFAALALGLVGDARAVRALLEAITALPDSERDIKCCALAALGLIDGEDPLAATAVPVLSEMLADERLDAVVRSYVPTTLGKLHHRDALPSLVTVFRDDRTANPVLQSVAIGIGGLATLDDVAAVDALLTYVERGRDQQSRHFALVSLGRIAAGGPSSASAETLRARITKCLRRELEGEGASREHRSWAALGAALLGRGRPDLQPQLIAALREAHQGERDPSFRGAFAIALALLDDRASAAAIAADLVGPGQDDLRGHAAEALGLLRHAEAGPILRGLCLDGGVTETLRLKAATGLGLLGDRDAVPLIVAALADARSLSALGSQARALGLIGDEDAATALLALVADGSRPPLPRAFALVALGLLGERERLPFNAALRADNNYYAQVPAIAEALRIL